MLSKSCVARKWRFPAAFSCGFQAPTFGLPNLDVGVHPNKQGQIGRDESQIWGISGRITVRVKITCSLVTLEKFVLATSILGT